MRMASRQVMPVLHSNHNSFFVNFTLRIVLQSFNLDCTFILIFFPFRVNCHQAYHYDLGVDLDNLWQESINVLNSMDGATRPPLKSAALGTAIPDAMPPAPPLPGCDC